MRCALTTRNLLAIGSVFCCCTLLAQRPRKENSKPGPITARQQLDWLVHAKLIDLTHPFDEKTIYWPTASVMPAASLPEFVE